MRSDRLLEKFLTSHGPVTGTLLGILATVSGYFTYLGTLPFLDPTGEDWLGRAAAAVFSVGVGVGIFGFWRFAFKLLPHLRGIRGVAGGTGITLCGLAVIVCVSSGFNVSALIGAGVLEEHMTSSITAYQKALDRAYRRNQAMRELQPGLMVESQKYSRLANAELNGGVLTGAAGRGAIVDTLNGAADRIKALMSEVGKGLKAGNNLLEKAGTELDSLRAVVSGEGGLPERMRQFAGHADKLDRLLGQLAELNVVGAVERQAEGLGSGTVTRANSRNAALAQAQTDAAARVRAELNSTGAALAAAAADIKNLPAAESPFFQKIGPMAAIFEYGHKFIPAVAAGIALDTLPLALLFFLVLGQRQCERRQEEKSPESNGGEWRNVTYGDAATLKEAHRMVNGGASPFEIEPAEAAIFKTNGRQANV